MQINDVSVTNQHELNVSRTQTRKTDGEASAHRELEPMKDRAQTSLLARLASEAIRQSHEEDTVREEKVAQFRFLAADDVSLDSDNVINAIFARMFA